jgi:hypothetical protein
VKAALETKEQARVYCNDRYLTRCIGVTHRTY